MSAHTAGPWRWLRTDALVQDSGHRHAVLTIQRGIFATTGEDGLLTPLIGTPNAALIAAAPELADALRALLDATSMFDHRPERDAAFRLLARIDGKPIPPKGSR